MLIDIARLHHLEQRLTDLTVTPDEFREYCWLEAHRSGALNSGLVLPDLNTFVTDAMLLQYWKAVDWWPTDMPGHLCPTLRELAMLAPHMADHTALTLQQMLEARAAKVVQALLEAKRSVVNPNETKAERGKRLNRERVARARGRKDAGSVPVPRVVADAAVAGPAPAVPAVPPAPPAVSELARLKAEAKQERSALDAWVREAHQEMLRRSEVRREVVAQWTARIEVFKQMGGQG